MRAEWRMPYVSTHERETTTIQGEPADIDAEDSPSCLWICEMKVKWIGQDHIEPLEMHGVDSMSDREICF